MEHNVTKAQLLQYVETIEALEAEKAALSEGIKEAFEDAKNNGFDIPALKQVLKLRKVDKEKLAEHEAMLEFYRDILEV